MSLRSPKIFLPWLKSNRGRSTSPPASRVFVKQLHVDGVQILEILGAVRPHGHEIPVEIVIVGSHVDRLLAVDPELGAQSVGESGLAGRGRPRDEDDALAAVNDLVRDMRDLLLLQRFGHLDDVVDLPGRDGAVEGGAGEDIQLFRPLALHLESLVQVFIVHGRRQSAWMGVFRNADDETAAALAQIEVLQIAGVGHHHIQTVFDHGERHLVLHHLLHHPLGLLHGEHAEAPLALNLHKDTAVERVAYGHLRLGERLPDGAAEQVDDASLEDLLGAVVADVQQDDFVPFFRDLRKRLDGIVDPGRVDRIFGLDVVLQDDVLDGGSAFDADLFFRRAGLFFQSDRDGFHRECSFSFFMKRACPPVLRGAGPANSAILYYTPSSHS